ncbi:MAG: hypothetical protein QF723_05565 [Phycisphaerales bacterium]|jgi:hypothetical protein|nr:hypothetical protein [Phycisphaerales bacterium]MDP6311898.1 hypothetical protein [Phycisphaerales bacterium]MDP7087977.1 hypothetical protein [Phycisphaerales bacterium]MDP7190101.1 hypothetical protein [Phycisphaerales bacterium]MDP7518539.1 hypothetical protein [Phycisphaerales bacterium]
MRRLPGWCFGFTVLAVLLAERLAMADLSALRHRVTQGGLDLPAEPSGGPSPLWGLTLSFLLALAVLTVSLLPSKRGHQD